MRRGMTLLALLLAIVSGALGCVPRDYGNGGTVCVCNATYCDSYDPLAPLQPRQFFLSVSSKDGERHNLTRKNFGTKCKNRGLVLTLNPEVTYQEIKGFGGAFTDSAGIAISSLPEGAQDNLLKSYFSAQGSAYSLGRVPIGGTDFSTYAYSLDDHPGDVTLKNFTLPREDTEYKIPYIKKAKELSGGKLSLLAAAWSPPPWMKTSNSFNGVGYLKPEYYNLWAKYHLRFLEEYDKHSLSFWALSTGNEPSAGSIPFYKWNCLGWSPQAQGSWVANDLGPMLRDSSYYNTLILAIDDQRLMLPWWLSLMFHDGQATSFISGVAVHWYWDNVAPPLLLDKTHDSYPDKFILATEACFTMGPFSSSAVSLGSWQRAEQYAESIIEDSNHWVSGWVDWNLALDEQGGPNWSGNFVDAAVIVNASAGEFYKQPMFYALSHFSKYVPPGSVRIHLEGATKQLQGTAYLTPDHHIVAVLLNKSKYEQHISLVGSPRGVANIVAPRKSIVTFICRAKKPPLFKVMDY